MTQAPRLSFAIPYYDNRRFLAEAVDSVRAQTVTDWELLVVDDAGPEPADDLIEAIGDPRIRYRRNDERLGLPGNWNECVAGSRGGLVTVLHGDDRLRPAYAERVLAAADMHPGAAAYFTAAALIDAEGQPTRTYVDSLKALVARGHRSGEVSGDAGLAALLSGNFVYCPSLCLRRDLVGASPFDPAWRFVSDWDFTVRQLLGGRSLVGVDEPLLEYRRHASQTTTRMTRDAQRFTEELAFLAGMEEAARHHGFPRAARAARLRFATRAHVVLSAVRDVVSCRARPARVKLGLLARDLHG